MLRTARSLVAIAFAAVLVAALAGPAMAAGPTREILDLDDPAWDADETAWITDVCGFAVDASVAGTWTFVVYPSDARHVVEIDHYVTRISYTNVATGTIVRLRDIGPDRFSVRDGRLYVAVTGRAVTSWGHIGQIVLDIESGEIVFEAGADTGFFYDDLCARLAA